MISHTLALSVAGNGNQTVRGASVSGNAEIVLGPLLAPSLTNQLLPIVFTRANCVSILITVDQAMTLKTNSGGSPADTFALVPGVPFFWQAGGGVPIPFSADVTAFYVTTGSVATNLAVRVLTP